MAVTACDLIDSFVSQLPNLKRVGLLGKRYKSESESLTYLEGVSVAVFRHLANDAAAVAKLAHFAATPRVKTSFLVGMFAVV